MKFIGIPQTSDYKSPNQYKPSNRCLINTYSLFMTDLFMTDLFITNTKDRPCISPPIYKLPLYKPIKNPQRFGRTAALPCDSNF